MTYGTGHEPKYQINPRIKYYSASTGASYIDRGGFDELFFQPFEVGVSAIQAIRSHCAELLPYLEIVKIHFCWPAYEDPEILAEGVPQEALKLYEGTRISHRKPFKKASIETAVLELAQEFGKTNAGTIERRIDSLKGDLSNLQKMHSIMCK